jgi:hypothetical protein
MTLNGVNEKSNEQIRLMGKTGKKKGCGKK